MLHINLAKPLAGDGKRCYDAITSPAGPPQSLGELCLELNEDAIRFHTRLHYAFAGDALMRFYTAMFIATAYLNARDLRRTLYHRLGTHKGHHK